MIADELQKLRDLYDQGAIDAAEYEQIKQRLLNNERQPHPGDLFGLSVNSYNALIHTSQYAGYVLPYVGLILPFVLWLRARDRYPEVDAHGRSAVNWIITEVIFTTILGLLGVVWFFSGTAAGVMAQNYRGATGGIVLLTWFVGLFVVGLVGGAIKLLSIICPLIAAVRALDGQSFQYPLAIRFLK